ncbi:MAG: NAD-binding protein [Pseudomonadales bacterium]|nr:NAD-binding protein [Pseudomonadales bacterium]
MSSPNIVADGERRNRRPDHQEQVNPLVRHEWTLVGLLAALTFVLGCVGYAQTMTFADDGGPFTWWDVTYASLRLFIFEAPEDTAGWPTYLQFARALAPLIVLYTAAKAVWRVIEEQVALYGLLFRKRRFVVVCGIGETGFRIARDYCLNSDKQVVVIDNDPLNALAAELKNYGAIVICGNAMDPLVLLKSQVIYAKELFLCTSDDKANIAIAKNAERLTRRLTDTEIVHLEAIARKREPAIGGQAPDVSLRCFLCVDSPDVYEIFSVHSFFEMNSSRFAIRLFNRRETIARNIFRICAPDLYYRPATRGNEPMHILFIGFEPLVREMILQTALTAHYTDFRLPHVTVLCEGDMRVKVDRFRHRHPHLDETVDIDFVYADPMTITPKTWYEMQTATHFDVCYVALRRDVESILSARRLNRLRRHSGLPPLNFVACLNQQNFLAEIIDDDFQPIDMDKLGLPDHEPIEYFESLDQTISIDIIVNEALDAMARTLHNAYLNTQLAAGASKRANASLIPWSELPAHKKKANRHAAAHMDVKLRIANCVACDIDSDEPEAVFPPDDLTMELLAQLEHRRWMADKHLAGYSYGDVRDEDRMLHPDLIPWEQLTEEDKEKDRANIRQIPQLLKMQDQKVCRMYLGLHDTPRGNTQKPVP